MPPEKICFSKWIFFLSHIFWGLEKKSNKTLEITTEEKCQAQMDIQKFTSSSKNFTHKNSRKRPLQASFWIPQNQTKKPWGIVSSRGVFGTTRWGKFAAHPNSLARPSTSPVLLASLASPALPLAPRPPLQRRWRGASATCLGRPEDLLLLGCPGKEVSTLQETNISHLEKKKRKIIFNMDFSGDMLVLRRVNDL